MAIVFVRLYSSADATIRLQGERADEQSPVIVQSLIVTRVTTEVVAVASNVDPLPAEILAPTQTADELQLKRPNGNVTASLAFKLAAETTDFLGVQWDVTGGVDVQLAIRFDATNRSIMVLRVVGRVRVDAEPGAAGPVVFTTTSVGFRCVWDDLPTFAANSELGLEFLLPADLRLPAVRIPFPRSLTLPSLRTGFNLPAYQALLTPLPIRWGWDAILVSVINANVKVVVRGLCLKSSEGDNALRCDLLVEYVGAGTPTIAISNAQGFTASSLHFRRFSAQCFGIDGEASGLARFTRLFCDELDQLGLSNSTTPFQLRVHHEGKQLVDLRLDWTPNTTGAIVVPLPGFELELAAAPRFTFVATPGASNGKKQAVALGMSLAASSEVAIRTTFGWPLDEDRQERAPNAASDSLLQLKFELTKALSVALFRFPLPGAAVHPEFMRKFRTPLSPLANECPEVDLETTSFVPDDVENISLELSPAQPIRFPFLNNTGGEHQQFVEITQIALDPAGSKFPRIATKVSLLLKLGTLQLTPQLEIALNIERMSFDIQVANGISILLPAPSTGGTPSVKSSFLGLEMEFEANASREILVLALDRRNYAIRQASGSKITIRHDKTTMPGDKLEFGVTDFAITPKGLDLTASILDRPARLNGLETQFRFTEGLLQIRENRAVGFAIGGTGPLPPDLVGDAVADVSLQFAEENGSIQLVRGAAKIRGPKLLECKSTRFEFELDSLGLAFVREGGTDHLYFKLSGKARYKLAAGDDPQGALAWLPGIELQLVDCPLTGNARVIAQHVQFLIELPRKVRFQFLGCFTLELRAIGFTPQFDKFAGSPAAMRLSGQVMLGDTGDVLDAKVDLHDLYIALPEEGGRLPRLYMKSLGIRIAQGDSFAIEAHVDLFNGEEIEPGIRAHGFVGEGSVVIKGLPAFAASMAWVRVSRDGLNWQRAWFLYLEARQLSLRVPVVEIYIREIGVGFGYRYTLAAFKEIDSTADVRQLLKKLKQISVTQGNLSKRNAWRLDLEEPGEDARWTVAMRALMASTSAQTSPFNGYNPTAEEKLACVYLLDVVLAVRSDLTFFMAGRAWLNTNYHDFHNKPGLKDAPLLNGFMVLSPKQSRFLANLSSNPEVEFGDHPPVPNFVKTLLRGSRYTATLLIEPGLLHYELGWPNQLQANLALGPLNVEVRAGQIMRLSTRELVVGQSLLARGKLELKAEFSAGFFGAGLYALADVAYGVRYIGVLAFEDPERNSAFYGAVGLDIRVRLSIQFWLRLKLGFFKISIDLSLSFELQITAALQLGVSFPEVAGALGTATVSIRVMGRRLGFNVRVGINDGAVEAARRKTERFLHIGLEAADVEAIPGTDSPEKLEAQTSASTGGNHEGAVAEFDRAASPPPNDVAEIAESATPESATHGSAAANASASNTVQEFHVPDYFAGVARGAEAEPTLYLLLLPSSPAKAGDRDGFLPPPPKDDPPAEFPESDFAWTLHDLPAQVQLLQIQGDSERPPQIAEGGKPEFRWQMPWNNEIEIEGAEGEHKIYQFLRYAYVPARGEWPDNHEFGRLPPGRDPDTFWIPEANGGDGNAAEQVVEDPRVSQPTAAAYDAAVRGAAEQFAAPYFRFDPECAYDRNLRDASLSSTSVYTRDGKSGRPESAQDSHRPEPDQAASEFRSSLLQAITRDFFEFAASTDAARRTHLRKNSPAFQYGLIFKLTPTAVTSQDPGRASTADEALASAYEWLEGDHSTGAPGSLGLLRQRNTVEKDLSSNSSRVLLFNARKNWFSERAPEFARVRKFSHANSIAIDWRLEFPSRELDPLSALRDDPEHHLRHYEVRREHLDGNDPTATFTLKAAEVLHRVEVPGKQESDPTAYRTIRLPPRFQLVDHFADENSADVAALTADGKLYLYTITPVDLCGNRSPRPLSVVIRRFPADPPLVPTDGELVVEYSLGPVLEGLPRKETEMLNTAAQLIQPASVRLRFSDPVEPLGRPMVPVGRYRVVFRREPLLPAGFYGADERVRGIDARGLAISNARPLRTDIVFEFPAANAQPDTTLVDPEEERTKTGRTYRELTLNVGELVKKGVFPGEGAAWKAEGWNVFLQTETQAGGGRPTGVRSTLAPASVRMRFNEPPAAEPQAANSSTTRAGVEERQFSRLEWLPVPLRMDLLPGVDAAGEVGFVKVPMPELGQPDGDTWKLPMPKWPFEPDPSPSPPPPNNTIPGVAFEQHPARTRAAKLIWNQGPSDSPDHPLDLHARYQVYEFDVFSQLGDQLHANEPIHFPTWSRKAGLQLIQEVDLTTVDGLANEPARIGDPQLWEAWYPSTSRRLLQKRAWIKQGRWPSNRDTLYGPWYSWRDSYLLWPETADMFDVQPDSLDANRFSELGRARRLHAFHPFLEDVAAILGRTRAGAAFPEFDIEFGPQPARGGNEPRTNVTDVNPLKDRPGALAQLIAAHGVETDPYGWSLLQRMGLAAGVRLRSRRDGQYIAGGELQRLVARAVAIQDSRQVFSVKPKDAASGLRLRLQATGPEQYYRISGADGGPAFELPYTKVGDSPTIVTPYVMPENGLVKLTVWSGSNDRPNILPSQFDDNVADAPLTLQPASLNAKRHLHLEYLFQPGARIRIADTEEAGAGAAQYQETLSLVQLSLRPALRQHLHYWSTEFQLGAGRSLPPGASVTLIVKAKPASMGATVRIDSGVPGPDMFVGPDQEQAFAVELSPANSLRILVRAEERASFEARIELNLPGGIERRPLTEFVPFTPVDWDAAGFAAAKGWRGAGDAQPTEGLLLDGDLFMAQQWRRLVMLLRGVEPEIPLAELDLSHGPVRENSPLISAWLDRFFVHGGDVEPTSGETRNEYWIATGYPRTAAPLPLSPDPAGRVTYYRPIESQWGQSYRYYVRPRGRYELIWEELGRSPKLLAPSERGLIEACQKRLAPPAPGGVDVVFPRIRKLDAPFILSSRRLDAAVPAGTNGPPGKIWEVLFAEHPEQEMADRNRTLVHRLEYRRMSQALVRRFDNDAIGIPHLDNLYRRAISRRHALDDLNLVPDTVDTLYLFASDGEPHAIDVSGGRTLEHVRDLINQLASTNPLVKVVASVDVIGPPARQMLVVEPRPGLPINPHLALRESTDPRSRSLLAACQLSWPENATATELGLPIVPTAPDHLDLSGGADPASLVGLDLPMRNSEFSRGVLALQYESLPYYYVHRLLAVTQAAHVVSDITVVEQRDFEYVSMRYPGADDCEPTMAGLLNADGKPIRAISIPLARLWDGLPASGQAEWPMESPVPDRLLPGALLDASVIYALVIARPQSGNEQVVAEFRYKADPLNPSASGFESRPLPGPFIGTVERLHRFGNAEHPVLETRLVPNPESTPELIIEPMVSRHRFTNIAGLTMWPRNQDLYPTNVTLRLSRPPTEEQALRLLAMASDADPSWADALRRLARSAEAEPLSVACIGLEQLAEIHDDVAIEPSMAVGDPPRIIWRGAPTPQQIKVITTWTSTSLFGQTFQAILNSFSGPDADVHEVPIRESFWRPRATQDALDELLRSDLLIAAGVVGHQGVMPHELAAAMAAKSELTPPELLAVRRMYLRALNSGLGGGVLRLQVRRGSAAASTRVIREAPLT
jgi:hypothetical protein